LTSKFDPLRRSLIAGSASAFAGLGYAATTPIPHDPFGRVEPAQPAPSLPLIQDDARQADLAQLLRGKTTAVQLMFTGCSATCPIQGALFAEVARRLPANGGLELLSLSIDPLSDNPPALSAWLKKFGPSRLWRAAAPRVGDVDRLLDFLRGRSATADRHTAQVYLFDRQARFVFRTPDLPPPAYVVTLLGEVASRG